MALDDRACMQAALAMAERSLGECWPNPAVGCVVVQGGRVVARGRTAATGRPHAEAAALALLADGAARGAMAYVSLEPCSHHGVTPPCAEALVAAGIGRCVVAMEDPDRRVNGQGIARLRAAGIAVEVGLEEPAARRLNAGFLLRLRAGRPLFTLKLASSLDGRIATVTGESRWITGSAARRAGHALRATHDAILVGAGTVAADDPMLDCRLAGARTRPLVRIVADSRLRTPLTARVLATIAAAPTWFACRADAEPARKEAFRQAGAILLEVAAGPVGVDAPALAARLGEAGLTRVLVEGGARLAASLLRAELVDRIAWFHAPAILGGDGLAAVQPFGADTLEQMRRFAPLSHRPVGDDMLTMLERIA